MKNSWPTNKAAECLPIRRTGQTTSTARIFYYDVKYSGVVRSRGRMGFSVPSSGTTSLEWNIFLKSTILPHLSAPLFLLVVVPDKRPMPFGLHHPIL